MLFLTASEYKGNYFQWTPEHDVVMRLSGALKEKKNGRTLQ